MWLTEMRESVSPPIMIKEVIPIIQDKYPKYDAQLHSKVERPDRYGIVLCKDAADAVCNHFGYQRKTSKSREQDARRTLQCRIYCRLNEAEYARLQTLLTAHGNSTVQEWLRKVIVEQLDEYERTNGKERQE